MGMNAGNAKNTRRPPSMQPWQQKGFMSTQPNASAASGSPSPSIPGMNDFGYTPSVTGADGQQRDRVTGEIYTPPPTSMMAGPQAGSTNPQKLGMALLQQQYPYSYGGAPPQQQGGGLMLDPTASTYRVPAPTNFAPPPTNFETKPDEMSMPNSFAPINVLDTKSAPVAGPPGAAMARPAAPATAPVASPTANPFQGTDLGDYWQGEGDKFFGTRNGQNFFNGRLFSPEGLSQSIDANQPGGGYANWLRSALPRFMKVVGPSHPQYGQMTNLLSQVGGPLTGGQDFGP
jgi:hypothetical protein